MFDHVWDQSQAVVVIRHVVQRKDTCDTCDTRFHDFVIFDTELYEQCMIVCPIIFQKQLLAQGRKSKIVCGLVRFKMKIKKKYKKNNCRCLIAYTGAGSTGHQEHPIQASFNHNEDFGEWVTVSWWWLTVRWLGLWWVDRSTTMRVLVRGDYGVGEYVHKGDNELSTRYWVIVILNEELEQVVQSFFNVMYGSSSCGQG